MKFFVGNWINTRDIEEKELTLEDIEKLLENHDIMIYKSRTGSTVMMLDEKGKKFRVR